MSQLRNLITDVPGVLVGNAQDARLASGATAIVFEAPAVGSIDVRGGGQYGNAFLLLRPLLAEFGGDLFTDPGETRTIGRER